MLSLVVSPTVENRLINFNSSSLSLITLESLSGAKSFTLYDDMINQKLTSLTSLIFNLQTISQLLVDLMDQSSW